MEPCLEPLRLNGLEFGFELPREPPGVRAVLKINTFQSTLFLQNMNKTHLKPTEDLRGVYPRPILLSLSLNESGVEADKEDRDGRDIAIDLDDRSRTYFSY